MAGQSASWRPATGRPWPGAGAAHSHWRCCLPPALQASEALQREVAGLDAERSRLARDLSVKAELEEGFARRCARQAAAIREAQAKICSLEASLAQVGLGWGLGWCGLVWAVCSCVCGVLCSVHRVVWCGVVWCARRSAYGCECSGVLLLWGGCAWLLGTWRRTDQCLMH